MFKDRSPVTSRLQTRGERVTSTPSLHLPQSLCNDLDSHSLIVNPWPRDRWNRTSSHGGVIDERGRGFNPHTEQMLNTRDDRLEPSSQHGTAEPTLLLHNNQHKPIFQFRRLYQDGFFPLHSTRVRDNTGVGSFLTADIACTFCQQVERGNLFIKG